MSSLPMGSSVGMTLRMSYNSLTREFVCSLFGLIDFGSVGCKSGVPSGRIRDEMERVFMFADSDFMV